MGGVAFVVILITSGKREGEGEREREREKYVE